MQDDHFRFLDTIMIMFDLKTAYNQVSFIWIQSCFC